VYLNYDFFNTFILQFLTIMMEFDSLLIKIR